MSTRESSSGELRTPVENRRINRSVDELTERNIEIVSKLEDAAREQGTPTNRIAAPIARFCGSMTFVWVHVVWFASWILLNSIPGIPHVDPFPFIFLTFVSSLEAIFLSTFILISQNLETRITDRRSHLDLQLNMLSEQENTKMITILLAIAEKVGADLSDDPHLEALSEEIMPERLIEQIEAREESSLRG